jgi:formylglycine-generating enzyme required for sulfatase activity
MTMPLARLSCLLSLLIAVSSSAVTMEWTFIGNPGNAADTTQSGAVGYAYSIGTYEVTNAQYTEFLNAKAASDPLGLYHAFMATIGGITRSGVSGSFTYNTIAGREDMPVNLVSFYDALRFTNWMNNGQGTASTEAGAYTLLGGTATPSNGTTVTRDALATVFLPRENEWYKAAYYSPTGVYFDYPTGRNAVPTCAPPSATGNRANCNNVSGLTIKGSYPGSASPYGTFDQGGNVSEWNEAVFLTTNRGTRGGALNSDVSDLAAVNQIFNDANSEFTFVGFRLVMIPEPSTGLLVIAGLFTLAVRRRISHSTSQPSR